MKIFVYGTLLFKPVMEMVVKQNFKSRPACLYNYTRNCIKGRIYPGIVEQRHSKVDGLIYYGVTQTAIQRLDYFEGIEYQRKTLQVKVISGELIFADTYVVSSEHINDVEEKHWDADDFQRKYMSEYIEHVKIIMASYSS
jgi:gamma-glutamylcyclotransferase (GGCT)/AIG2-like uncharacterized protein YtfP